MSTTMPRYFVRFDGHVTFELAAPTGEVVLVDPFFADQFAFEGHIEHRLTPAAVRPQDMVGLSAIAITHIHGDHFDAEATLELLDRLQPQVIAPPDVLDDLESRGAPRKLLRLATPGAPHELGPWRIVPLPNGGNEDDRLCLRLSYVLETGDRRVFHSGDSHHTSPAWGPYIGRVDLALVWFQYMRLFAEFLQAREAVFMHYDRFTPGEFVCNADPEELLAEARNWGSNTTYRILERGQLTAFL